MTKQQKTLFELLQVALGSRKDLSCVPTDKDWTSIYTLSDNQNIIGIVFGGIEKLPKNQLPNMDLLMNWLGQAECNKTIYTYHKKAISELASFYQKHNIEMMLLKGYGLSLDYLVPSLRPCGDIDIFLYGKQEFADAIIAKSGIEVHNDNPHHSTFTFSGITVENHSTLMDQNNHRSNIRIEKIFQKLIAQDAGKVIGENTNTPSPTLNAIYLLRHAAEHFTSSEITLRQMLDVGCFFTAHSNEIEWNYVHSIYHDENMTSFYNAIATICVRNLGMKADTFVDYEHDERLADRVLEDIFAPKEELQMNTAGLSGFRKVNYGMQKIVRWWNNRWKYKMVYKENLWESFSTLALNRLKN